MPRTSPRPIVKPTGSYDPWVLQAIAEGRAGWAALPEWSGPPAAAARARGDHVISRPLAADLLPTALELARDLARDNDDRAGKWHDATWHDAPCMATAPKRRLKRQQLIAADKMRALMNSVPARTLFGDEERLAAAPPLPSSDSESDDGAAEAAIAVPQPLPFSRSQPGFTASRVPRTPRNMAVASLVPSKARRSPRVLGGPRDGYSDAGFLAPALRRPALIWIILPETAGSGGLR